MGDFGGSYISPYDNPTFGYYVSYAELSRGGGSASYQVDVTASMQTQYDYFGYNLDVTVTIGNASQTIRFKEDSPAWEGTQPHSFSFILNPTGLSNAGGTVPARLQASSDSGASGIIDTGDGQTVNLSSYGGLVRVWNGSAWELVPAKVWNGSGFVAGTVHVWDGSSWVLSKS